MMEKKTKKLQLRKETIAVLNGQRMTNVVGGVGYNPCENGGIFDGQQCVCPAGFVGLNCEQPVDAQTSRNGEMCQDTVGSYSVCQHTCKDTCIGCR